LETQSPTAVFLRLREMLPRTLYKVEKFEAKKAPPAPDGNTIVTARFG